MPDFTPTQEQQAIIDAYLAGKNLVINAFAGTGKTTTLRVLAEANPRARVLYLAYNKSAQIDARGSFPVNARCLTSHGLAYQPMAHMSQRIGGKRLTGNQLAKIIRVSGPTRLTQDRVLAPAQIASIVRQTIRKFCYSADEQVTGWHVPSDIKNLSDPEEIKALRKIIPPIAQRVWDEDITVGPRDPSQIRAGRFPEESARFPVDHDYYLKAYALTHPRLPGDVIMLDEAQDSNPCVAAMVREQAQYGLQLIMVGDQNQAIYGWRGAVDAMADFGREPGVQVLCLTQSFRFGPEIAAEGNKWLQILGCDKPLIGWDKMQSRVGESPQPDAILCRTNAEALKQAIAAINAGKKVAFPGGVNELKHLTWAAERLQTGRLPEHPDLDMFATWGQVQDFVETDDEGADLKRFVELVDEHGTDGLLAILEEIQDDGKAKGPIDVTISTAHKAKGREWRIVQIATDFREPKRDPEAPRGSMPKIPRADAMLAYVAATRAMYVLNPEGLLWVNAYLPADDEPASKGASVAEDAPAGSPASVPVVAPAFADAPLDFALEFMGAGE